MTTIPPIEDGDDLGLNKAIQAFLNLRDADNTIDRSSFIEEHPNCADELRRYFETMDRLEQARSCDSVDLAEQRATTCDFRQRVTDSSNPWDEKTLPIIFGDLKVVKQLGLGGMGTVYLANNLKLQRYEALKVPHGGSPSDSKWIDRFWREARATPRHANICQTFDAGEIDGRLFIRMQYIDGLSLDKIIAGHPDGIPERECATLIGVIASAMQTAHQADIIHRDLKPKNIMVDTTGQPFVTDFGLSFRLTEGAARITSDGQVLGTILYMSPEQIEGRPEAVTSSSDIYSLGVTFFELLTGTLPFSGNRTDVINQILCKRPPLPSSIRNGINSRLESICMKMMAKSPQDRPASMQVVVDSLDEWLEEGRSQSDVAQALSSLGNEIRKIRLTTVVGGAALSLLGLANLFRGSPDDDGSDTGGKLSDGWTSGNTEPPKPTLSDQTIHTPPIHLADPLFGSPVHDQKFWQGQQNYADTCAIRCQEFILQQFTGVDFPEKHLVDEAKTHGWYTPGHGTSLPDVGNLLELHGIEVHRYTHANAFHLANELAQGHKVIIGVESSKLWGHNSAMDSLLDSIRDHFGIHGHADHAVVVSGIDTSDPYHVKVIISDPGDGRAVAAYPMEQFLHAWEGSHFFMVATQDAAPAHLPEMVHFDYGCGHLESVADMPYDHFVEKYGHDPEAWDHHLHDLMEHHSTTERYFGEAGSLDISHPNSHDDLHPHSDTEVHTNGYHGDDHDNYNHDHPRHSHDHHDSHQHHTPPHDWHDHHEYDNGHDDYDFPNDNDGRF